MTRICGNGARDPSTGKVFTGPHAKKCERELGHRGPHRIGPHGDLESVVEWTDAALGWVAFNRNPTGTKAKNMAKSKKNKPTTNIPHEAGCGCGPCHNDRTQERATKPQKLPPEACRVLDGIRGRGCIYKKGHDGYHFTGMRMFRDAAPPAAKPKKAKKPARSPKQPAPPPAEAKSSSSSSSSSKKADPRCASKQMSDRCDLPTGHNGAHLACVSGAGGEADVRSGAEVKTWNASESNSWPCCTAKSNGTPQLSCRRPDEHNGGHRTLVRNAGGIEIAAWKDGAAATTSIELHDAAAQLLADKLDRAGRPAGAAPAARPMTLEDEPEDPETASESPVSSLSIAPSADSSAVARANLDDQDEEDDRAARWECGATFVGDDGRDHECEGRNEHNGPHYAFCRVLNRTVNAAAPSEDGGQGASDASDMEQAKENATIQTGQSSGLNHPPAKLYGRRRHAAGALWSFTDLWGEDFDKFVASLKARDAAAREADAGDDQALINAIVLVEVANESGELEKFILDGWNRARGCEAAGVKPRFVRYAGATDIDTLLEYVDAVNDKRRHLTSGQRAAIAAEAEGLRQGQRADGTARTQVERAAAAGTTDRQIRRAETVKESVTPKVWEAVKRGKVALDAAKQAIGLPAAKQDELAERALAGGKEMKTGKFTALARQEKKREVVRKVNSGKVPPMPMGPFGLIVVDYPWKFENSDQHEGSRGHMPYQSMSMAEIYAHAAEATKRAADDCVLGLWVTNAHLLEVKAVLEAWGFTYQAPITWDKVHVGMGISGPRGQTEHLILAYRGAPAHTLNELTTLIRTPRETGHSKKPDLFYDLLAKHCAGPRLELFAIGDREGWETWGAEASGPIATDRKPKSKIYTATDEAVAARAAP